MGGVASTEGGSASSVADEPTSDNDQVAHNEIVTPSRPQPTVVNDDQPALTGENVTTGAQLRGQNGVVSQPTGLRLSADIEPSVRPGSIGWNPSFDSASSQYYSPEPSYWNGSYH